MAILHWKHVMFCDKCLVQQISETFSLSSVLTIGSLRLKLLFYRVQIVDNCTSILKLLNPLPDDKILDWFNLKQLEDDILKYILN